MRAVFKPRSRRLLVVLVCAGLVAGVAWHGVTHHNALENDAAELCLALAATALIVVPRQRPRARVFARRLSLALPLAHSLEPARAPAPWPARAGPTLLQVFRR
jgi:hypothetical protein